MKDIDKRFYVVTTGVDLSDNPAKPYRISLRLAITSAKAESGSSRTDIQTIEAASIAEGVRHLKAYVDKELEFGHCRVFVLGKSLLESSSPDAMSWFARRRDIQMISYFAVGEPDALSVLKITPESERYPGNALFLSFGNEGTESPYTVTSYLFDNSRRLLEKGIDPVLPIIRTQEKTYVIDRVMLLDKKKPRLTLTPGETQLYKMISSHSGKSELVLPLEDGKRVVMTVSDIKAKVHIKRDSVPVITVKIRMGGTLEESPPNLLEKDWHGLERRMADRYSKQMEQLLIKIRDAGVDPLGFGLKYLSTYFGKEKDYKWWQSVYPEAKFNVVTDVRVRGPGVIR